MANTLTNGATVLTLPDDMLWPDEFAWREVEQKQSYTIAGALIVEAARKLAGREITLAGGDDYGFMRRADLLTLQTWSKTPGLQMALAYRGGAPINVVFDHARGAIDARPIFDYSDPDPLDWYVVAIKLMEV